MMLLTTLAPNSYLQLLLLLFSFCFFVFLLYTNGDQSCHVYRIRILIFIFIFICCCRLLLLDGFIIWYTFYLHFLMFDVVVVVLVVVDCWAVLSTCCCVCVSVKLIDLFRVQVNGHNQTVETQHFGEDENQDHADEQTRLLCCSPHTGVSHDADRETGCQAREAHRQTGAQMNETPIKDRYRN